MSQPLLPRLSDLPSLRDAIGPYQIPFTDLGAEELQHPSRRKIAQVPPRTVASLQSEIRRLADELNNSLYHSRRADLPQIHNPADAVDLLLPLLGPLDREELWVLCLNTRNRVVHLARIYSGSVNSSQVRVAEVFRPAIIEIAPSILVAHNHPSGDPTPSPEDITITRALVQAGKLLDIEVLDHLVIGSGKWCSLKERGLGFS